ncbi:MAG: aspartate carbamoyltransferase catalytic subunit [Desulfovibrionaceae bacterium]
MQKNDTTPYTSWSHTNLLDISQLNLSDINTIFSYATMFSSLHDVKKDFSTLLKGKSITLFFAENSTRTRLSFEIAAQKLGLYTQIITKAGSSIAKGESLQDTVLTLQALKTDLLVFRSEYSGASQYVSQFISIPLINAGDGKHAHPTQALLDLFTLAIHWKHSFSGKIVLIVGDILHSRVARSVIMLLKMVNITIRLCAPKTLIPRWMRSFQAEYYTNLKEAAEGVHAIMALRLQTERQDKGLIPSISEYYKCYGITEHILSRADPSVSILHPGPINQNVDIDAFLAVSDKSLILKQVESGLFVRMALLYLLLEDTILSPEEILL